jgi:protein TonB
VGDLRVDDSAISGLGDFPDSVISGDGVIAPPPPSPRARQEPIRVGSVLQAPKKTHHVAPEYPSIARSARVSGTVILEAVLAEDGSVQDVRVLRSIKLLDDAAIEAVRQWRFTPTLLNGQPQRVLMTVTVTFTLN